MKDKSVLRRRISEKFVEKSASKPERNLAEPVNSSQFSDGVQNHGKEDSSGDSFSTVLLCPDATRSSSVRLSSRSSPVIPETSSSRSENNQDLKAQTISLVNEIAQDYEVQEISSCKNFKPSSSSMRNESKSNTRMKIKESKDTLMEIEEDSLSRNSQLDTSVRVTFSVESETQDLLELGASLKETNYTQNQFVIQGATKGQKKSSPETRALKIHVVFQKLGRLSDHKLVHSKRVPVVFKLLGKLQVALEKNSQLLDVGVTRAETKCAETQTICSNTTVSTQTASDHECKVFFSVETQVYPSELPLPGSSTSSGCLSLNSNDFLQPSYPPAKPEINRSLHLGAQTKRNRDVDGIEDCYEISACKRQRSSLPGDQNDNLLAAKEMSVVGVSSVNPPLKSPPAAVEVTQPKTKVMESDTESEDIFSATPEPPKSIPRIVPKVFVCSSLIVSIIII